MSKFKTRSGLELDGHYIYSLMNDIKAWRTPYRDNWIEYYKRYRSYRESGNYPFRSNIFVPFTFSLVETVVPMLMGALFNVEPLIAVTARKGAVYELSTILEDGLAYYCEDARLGLYRKFEDFFKDMAIYGTAFAKILPKFTKRDVYNRYDKARVPELDYIDVEAIDPFKVYPDWRGTDIHSMRFIIIEHDWDIEELWELVAAKRLKASVVKQLEEWHESSSKIDEAKQERLSGIGVSETHPPAQGGRKMIKFYEYWDKNCQIWVGGEGEVIMKEVKNPFGRIPFVMKQFCRVPHEVYGIGIPEMIEDLQEELNTIRNQRMDNINLIINRMWVANRLADIDFENLVSFAGNIILTNDMDAIEPLKTQDVTASSYKEEEVLIGDIENTSGIFRYTRGGPPQRRETATGIIRLQQASNIRFETILKGIEFDVIREMSSLFLSYMRKFMTPEMFAMIVGPKMFMENAGPVFFLVPVDQVLKNYHFKPMGSSLTAIKELQAQQTIQAFQMLVNLTEPGQPAPDGTPTEVPIVNRREFAKMVLKEVFDQKNADRIINPGPGQAPPEPPTQKAAAAVLPGKGLVPQQMGGAPPGTEQASNTGQNYENMMRNIGGLVPENMKNA